MQVVVIGEFRLSPERMAEARPLMAKVIQATRAEDGCIQYNYAEDMLEPGHIRISEVWESQEHLTAHLSAPHMKVWIEERATLSLSGRVVTAYTASSSQSV